MSRRGVAVSSCTSSYVQTYVLQPPAKKKHTHARPTYRSPYRHRRKHLQQVVHFSHPSRLTDPTEEMKVPILSLLVVSRIKWSHSLASTNKNMPRLSKSAPSFGSSGGERGDHATVKSNNCNQLIDINVQTKVQTVLSYNPDLDRYVATSGPRRTYFRRHIKSLFIPQGVSHDYYNFMIWRIIQRYVNAILQVFGTQSLLLALGKKSSLTQAAALNWILKDTLGKLTRLIYGSLTSNKLDAGKLAQTYIFMRSDAFQYIIYT